MRIFALKNKENVVHPNLFLHYQPLESLSPWMILNMTDSSVTETVTGNETISLSEKSPRVMLKT